LLGISQQSSYIAKRPAERENRESLKQRECQSVVLLLNPRATRVMIAIDNMRVYAQSFTVGLSIPAYLGAHNPKYISKQNSG
jgi:hypothetical protein